eukprot:TRINITY_DN3766_c3_g1_i1.p1 TRINITY_DN3766_c3_g1~~TRINITY_DN3766_c3_g1_i1.p1  ORF type:complete len:164 (+),score=54.40 TRINITY_DN3766_c3_g1_i1:332-823(+)
MAAPPPLLAFQLLRCLGYHCCCWHRLRCKSTAFQHRALCASELRHRRHMAQAPTSHGSRTSGDDSRLHRSVRRRALLAHQPAQRSNELARGISVRCISAQAPLDVDDRMLSVLRRDLCQLAPSPLPPLPPAPLPRSSECTEPRRRPLGRRAASRTASPRRAAG